MVGKSTARVVVVFLAIAALSTAGVAADVVFTDFCNVTPFTINGAGASRNPNADCVLPTSRARSRQTPR